MRVGIQRDERTSELDFETEEATPVRLARGTTEIRLEPRRDYLRAETIAGIVHDLKTPLSTIALEVSLLDAREGVSAETHQALGRIEHNVLFLDRMVRDLLDATSIDDGHFTLRLRTAELRSLIVEVVERVVGSRDRTRVFLYTPEAILAPIDDSRIERVIANLIANAFKYSPPGSDITVGLERRGELAYIFVDDLGPGLTHDEKTYVFDKYRRAASAVRQDGVGLGLYVSRKIIEQHGGRIGVDSAPNLGSRFYFELPCV